MARLRAAALLAAWGQLAASPDRFEELACALRRVDARELSERDFRERYQGKEPLLLTHVADSWAATQSWATPELIAAARGDAQIEIIDPRLLRFKGSYAPAVRTVALRAYLEALLEEPDPIFRNRWCVPAPWPLLPLLLHASGCLGPPAACAG
eukprot:COSAG04_NODE_966_length_9138_cov_6.958624_1_plen_153_part_00